MSVFRRFLNLWRQSSLENEFDAELLSHSEMRVEANMRAGMSRADAEAEARKHLGSALRTKEGMREARVIVWMESLAGDLRHGIRLLRRQPGLAALVVLTLSLGIGANATVFSLLNAVLIRPLPFPEPDRLISVVDGFLATGVIGTGPTVPELIDLGTWSQSLERVSFFDTRDFQINGGTEPARVFAARVEASFLSVLGVHAAHGRLFEDGENLPGRDRVVVLTDGLWRRNFGGDPGIVGHQIVVNGAPSTVIGVMPPEFAFNYLSPEPIEMYVPFTMSETYTSWTAEFANVRRVMAVARLRPDYSRDSASAELKIIARRLATEHPALYSRGSDGQDAGFFMDAVSLRDVVAGRSRPIVLLLFSAVGLVLLIACVNTAQFLLARSMERAPEVAVRSALGASHGRLVRQFLAEALILVLAGGVAGLLQAVWLTKAFIALVPAQVPLVGHLEIDSLVIAFTVAAVLTATIVSGLVPALHFSRHSLGSRMGGRGFVSAHAPARQILIAVEVAISVVLLVMAGLLVQSLRQLQNAPGGYSAERVTTMRMRIVAAQTITVGQRILEPLAAIPGIESVALGQAPLPGGAGTEFAIEGRADDAATLSRQLASYLIVSPEYFSTLRIPLLEGRTFNDDDIAGRQPVAIVNDDMARRFWPGRSPVGERIRSGEGPRSAVMTIVGVVGSVRPVFQIETIPQIYVSYRQQNEPNMTLLVRSATETAMPLKEIKQAVWSILPGQPLFGVRPLKEIVSEAVADQRTVARLLGGFALLALFMSATGVYTVVTYLTSRRTKEIAIRRAIGAQSRNVLGLLAGQTFGWALAGLMIGMVGSVAASVALRALFSVVRLEATTVLIVGALYLIVVTVAICLPALKALRVNPSNALRIE